VFVAIGIVGFQIVGSTWFPTPPGGGMNWTRVAVAGLVGAGSALIGFAIGKLIESMMKKKD
jgi:hypothetical protein